MRSTTASLLLLVLAGCASAPGPEAPPPPRDMTLVPGTAWIYVDETGKEYTTRVEGPTALDGVPCVKVRGCSVGVAESRWEGQDVACWSLKDGVPVLHGVGEDDYRLTARSPVPLYRRNAERGIAWEGRFWSKDAKTGLEDAAGCKFISGGVEDVATGAGAFHAHHVLEEWSYRGKVVVRIESWWADGVGVVRQIYRTYNKDDVVQRTLRLDLKVFLQVAPPAPEKKS